MRCTELDVSNRLRKYVFSELYSGQLPIHRLLKLGGWRGIMFVSFFFVCGKELYT